MAASGDAGVMLRPATMADAGLLFEWANDPTTREASFNPDPISWERHIEWLTAVLSDDDRRLWVAFDRDEPVGQVRLDKAGAEEVISVSLSPSARGRGLAAQLIRAACDESWRPVIAEIRRDNLRSMRAFITAGFTEALRTEDRIVMRRERHGEV